MPNITTCSACGALYEASSEETANEPNRACSRCRPRVVIDYSPHRIKATASPYDCGGNPTKDYPGE